MNKNLRRTGKKKSVERKRGAEVIENILMMGIAVSIIVVIFYPQLSNLMSSTFTTLETWFNNAINSLVH